MWTLCVDSSVPLCAESPLRAELIPKASKTVAKKMATGGATRRHPVHDQPLTFHSKVKSSGYTAQPRKEFCEHHHYDTNISSPFAGTNCLLQILVTSQSLLVNCHPTH